MSLSTFRIEFDRPGATYSPGEIITGNIIIELVREKTIRALKLSIKGEANVSWEKESSVTTRSSLHTQHSGRTSSEHFRANEQYFNVTYHLLGNSGGGEVRLPAGFNKHPFSFMLPSNIPCSFEHRDGYIRYTMKAVIDRPWRFDHESKIAFTVVTPYDLNAHVEQCLGVDDETRETFCCFCCYDMGSMKLRVTLPMTGFVPGQSIETKADLENTSSVNVTKICVKLERCLKFNASSPYKQTKKDKATVNSSKNVGPFSQHADIVSRLQVPPISPSELQYCTIIEQEYSIQVTVHVSGMHCSMTKSYPVLIGTIPLRSTIPSYQQAVPQATAPTHYDPLASTPMPMPMPTVMQMPMPMPMPMSSDYVQPNVSYPGPQPIGFNSSNQPSSSNTQWDMPPPSYKECMQRADSIKDDDESNYVYGANEPFAPRYPVFNFPPPYPLDK